jgi:voltage-gated potassium channel
MRIEPFGNPEPPENTIYELFIGGLSLLALVNIALYYLVQSDIVDGVVLGMDVLLSIIFLLDFFRSLARAPSKKRYFFREFGWADLFSCLPIIQIKILRIFRVLKVAHIVQSKRPRVLIRNLIAHRAESVVLSVLFMLLVIAEFGGMGVAWAEGQAEGANIKSGGDAIWYVFVTITTIGYGDRYPVTEQGRLIGLLIMVSGVGVFAVFTGYIANLFLRPPPPILLEAPEPEPPDARAKLAAVQEELQEYEKGFAELRKKLNDIEKSL